MGSGGALVQGTSRLACVGVPLCAHGLAPPETGGPVGARLPQALAAPKRAAPDDDCALVSHREPPRFRRLHALFCAPWVGLDRLPACDPRAPPLQTLLRRGDHRATLGPCLGPLARRNASEARRPPLVPAPAGPRTSGAGPRSAAGSRVPLHPGQRTGRGRSMAGSHAGLAPAATGQALWVADDPPDLQLSPGLVASGQQGGAATGSARFVIARALPAGARARAVNDQGVGGLCRLDDKAEQGLDRVAATQVAPLEEGTRGERGPGQGARPDAPSRWGLGEPPAGQPWVYGATPQGEAVLEGTAWPRGARARHARPAQSGKRMLAPGARDLHAGRQCMVGPDRPQHRARATLEPARAASQQRVDQQTEALKAQQAQGAASAVTGHGIRLAPRPHACAVWDKAVEDAPPQDRLAAHVHA